MALGALDMRADVLMLQETKLTDDSLRASRAEARRAQYWGHWTPACRRVSQGAASGGLAMLTHTERPWRKIAPGEEAPHAQAGRRSHAVVLAGGAELHLFNVYGWLVGSPDHAARQSALWVELFAAIAGLGNAPWIAGGDWNAEPYEIWAHVLEPRVGGYLPEPALRQPTCFLHNREPRELDFLLISHSLAHSVVGYETGQPGPLPVHCGGVKADPPAFGPVHTCPHAQEGRVYPRGSGRGRVRRPTMASGPANGRFGPASVGPMDTPCKRPALAESWDTAPRQGSVPGARGA